MFLECKGEAAAPEVLPPALHREARGAAEQGPHDKRADVLRNELIGLMPEEHYEQFEHDGSDRCVCMHVCVYACMCVCM